GEAAPGNRCLALHAVGLAVPGLSPGRRCALTAPFHPCWGNGRSPVSRVQCPVSRIAVEKTDSLLVTFRWLPTTPLSGLFSVALSRAPLSPAAQVGVTHHRVLSCSDFPPA